METRKVCRLLIVIFAFLTLLFFFLYKREFDSKSVLSEEFVESAVINLENSGVSVDEQIIQRQIPESDIYVFELDGFEKYHNDIIDAIRTVVFDERVNVEHFSVPVGVAAGLYDVKDSSKELGRVVFSGSDFSFSFSKNGVNLTGGNEAIISSESFDTPDFVKACLDKFSSILNSDTLCSYRVCGVSESDELYAVSVVQTVDGKDINEVFLNLVFENGELVIMKGSWITSSPKAKYHNSLVDGINALYMLDLNSVSEIRSEQIVYSLRKGENNRYFLVPGWEISYKDKAGAVRKSYVDAL